MIYKHIQRHFPLTPPTGYTAPFEALYQFDGSVDAFKDRTVNGRDLTPTATPLYVVCNKMKGWWCRFNGESYSDIDSGLVGLGAMTMESIITAYGATQSTYIMVITGTAGETEAENTIMGIGVLVTSGRIYVWHEYGAGVDSTMFFDDVIHIGMMNYLAVTREADGVTYHLYMDGVYKQTVVAAAAPTGGANVRMRVGGGGWGQYFCGGVFGARVSKGVMSSAQIATVSQALHV